MERHWARLDIIDERIAEWEAYLADPRNEGFLYEGSVKLLEVWRRLRRRAMRQMEKELLRGV
jgi:hypothetical protein